jgi:aspartate racemase
LEIERFNEAYFTRSHTGKLTLIPAIGQLKLNPTILEWRLKYVQGECRMKTLGVIGGIGPESTIEYYRHLIAAYRALKPDGSYPAIVINSINMKTLLDMIEANDRVKMAEFLVGEIQKLVRAGAQCGLLAANTPHIVFDEVRRQSPIQLVSIVEATCEAAKVLGLKRLGLFGTRFTMLGDFYPRVFFQAKIALVVPQPREQAYIHERYMNELVKGVILPETRQRLLVIVDRMKEQEHIDGLILGGTELPLILGDVTDRGIPFLDTTRIHAQAAVAQLWS